MAPTKLGCNKVDRQGFEGERFSHVVLKLCVCVLVWEKMQERMKTSVCLKSLQISEHALKRVLRCVEGSVSADRPHMTAVENKIVMSVLNI